MNLSRSNKVPYAAVSVSKATDSLKHVNLTVGQRKVLEGLEKGRRNAAERSKEIGAQNAVVVIMFANRDIEAGYPARGRAKRIAIDLGGKLTERSVKRILDRLSE